MADLKVLREGRKDFHLKEYESLKKEVADQVEHSRKLEIYALGGLAAFYAWFISAKRLPNINLALWIPVGLAALATLRAWAVQKRIAEIAYYLRRLEFVFAWNENHVFGWETHRLTPGQKGVPPDKEKKESWFGPFTTSGAIFWAVLLVVSLLSLWLLKKAESSADCVM